MNNSSTGGPLYPNPVVPVLESSPVGLSLVDFIQRVLVGISGFDGTLVRPDWQPEQPKEPDISINWLAFGIRSVAPDANAYEGFESDGVTPYLQRNELLQVSLSVYGPQAYENMGLIRDSFQLTQNLASLKKANMGFAYDDVAQHVPDLVGQRWFNRYLQNIFLRRQIVRTYPILDFISASGVIHTSTAQDQNFSQNWKAGV